MYNFFLRNYTCPVIFSVFFFRQSSSAVGYSILNETPRAVFKSKTVISVRFTAVHVVYILNRLYHMFKELETSKSTTFSLHFIEA